MIDLMPKMAAARPARARAPDPSNRIRALCYAFLFACLLLAGCAALEQRPAPSGPIGSAFYVSGRVSVKFNGDAEGGRFSWEHSPAKDDMLISSPLGQGVAHIVRNDATASLTTSDQKVYQARSVEGLTEKVLGWRLPLAGLPDWVRGRAMPQVPAQEKLDAAGRLAELRQSGWLVEYLGYSDSNGMPVRLQLSRDDVEIRLAIDQWRNLP